MIPKTHRLTHSELEAVKTSGQSFKTAQFTVLFRTASSSKFGLIISKKIASKAVSRNRLKRQLYAALPKSIIEKSMTHWVIIPRPVITKQTTTSTSQTLNQLLENLWLKHSSSI